MSKDSSGRSFAEYLQDAPLAPDASARIILTGEVRRSADDSKFVFSSPESGTLELDVAAVLDFEPLDGGQTRITLNAAAVRDAAARRGSGESGGRVPFVMATPHRASAASIRAQLRRAEMSAAILDVETAFIKDVWGDGETTDAFFDVPVDQTLPF
jgi:hypothetical protein